MTDKYYTLANGNVIPTIGFGTWRLANGSEAYDAVSHALKVGYRHIDTAEIYGNEESIGQAIKDSQVPREDIFLTTKVWNDKITYEETLAGFQNSLDRLQTDYVDLLLIHWPNPKAIRGTIGYKERNKEVWQALEALYQEGKARAIGISNFMPHHLEALLETAEIKPMVNQILLAPGTIQEEIVNMCRQHHILLEAYSPFGSGDIFKNAELQEIADKYDRSIAQIALRWSLQNEFLPLPRSSKPKNIEQNLDVFGFELAEEDMEKMTHLESFVTAPNPDERDF